MKKIIKPRWVGPGRVVFHETIQGQHPSDARKQVVWVVIGGTMRRCSVHSVRRVSSRERLEHELHSPEDPSQRKSLRDLLPQRSYVDITPEEQLPEEEGMPDLPPEPGPETHLFQPTHRHRFKSGPTRTPTLPPVPEASVNSYEPTFVPGHEDEEELGNTGIGSGIPTLEERSSSSRARLVEPSSMPPSEPESKKPRLDGDEDGFMLSCLQEVDELYVLEVDLVLETNNQKRKLIENPSLFLAQKLRDCEVRLDKLPPEHRELFRRAKLKEVNSFIANQAVRRCANLQEERDAHESGRLMRCRGC